MERPDGSFQLTNYDGWGQMVSRSGWMRSGETPYATTYQFNDKGRVTGEFDAKGNPVHLYPDEPSWKTVRVEEQTLEGVVLKGIDDRGFETIEVRDLLGHRMAIKDEANHLVAFKYDLLGNLIETDNGGQKRSYSYNY